MKRERLRIHRPEEERPEEHRSVFPRPSGQSLEPAARGVLEPRFGHSLENIRIHADEHADHLTQNADAAAMTVGQDVFFRQGRYDPGSDKGMSLLTHEVAHTVQNRELPNDWGQRTLPSFNQIGRRAQNEFPTDWGDRKLELTQPSDVVERGARNAVSQGMADSVAPSIPALTGPIVARLTTSEEAQMPAQAAATKQSWVRSFAGTLDGSVPIHLHLERHGNTLTGFSSGSAERTDDVFNLKGFVTDGAKLLILEAKDASGKLVRTFHGAFSQEGGSLGVEGTWSATSSDKPPKQLRAVSDGSAAGSASVVQGPSLDDKPAVRWDHPRHFAGTIDGSIPIHLSLQREGNALSGYSSGTSERGADSFDISGVISADAKLVALEAKDATGKIVRTFQGSFSDAKGKKLEGEWVHTGGQGGGKRLSVTEESTAAAGGVKAPAPRPQPAPSTPSVAAPNSPTPSNTHSSGQPSTRDPRQPANFGRPIPPTQTQPTQAQQGADAPDKLDTLMGLNHHESHYSVEEIRRARDLIVQEQNVERRNELFLLLQAKVNYHNQRNNATLDTDGTSAADGMCNVTSLAMALENLGIGNPDPQNFPQYEDYLDNRRSKGHYGARITIGALSKIADEMGADFEVVPDSAGNHDEAWWKREILPYLQKGNGIMMSIKGHIVRVQNVTNDGLIIDDPFGGDLKLLASKTLQDDRYFWPKGKLNSPNSDDGKGAKGEDSLWIWARIENHYMNWIAKVVKKAEKR